MTIVNVKTKECSRCKKEKGSSEFHSNKGRKDGLQSWCKECFREFAYGSYSPEQRRKRHIKTYYGMDWDRYLEMLKNQDHKCAICLIPLEAMTFDRLTTAHIDHNHKTGEVRHLLCHFCNSGLGYFKDDIELLKKAIEYLNEK